MWKAMKEVYGSSWRFMVAVPLVAAIPVVAELAQHAAEYQAGMYDSFAMAEATAADPARMGLGYVKMLSLALLGYWVVRFMGSGEDRRRTVALPRTAVLLFAGVLLFELAFTAVHKLGGEAVTALVADQRVVLGIGLLWLLLALALGVYLVVWKVGAALGNSRLTISASFRLMRGNLWWSFAFTLLMMLPLMIAHYALGLGAIGRPPAVALAMLFFDALLVGYLGTVLVATNYAIARRAADRAGVTLDAGEPRVAGPLPA